MSKKKAHLISQKISTNDSINVMRSCLASDNWLEHSLETIEHFPPVPFYGDLLKHRSKQFFRNGEDESGVFHLCSAHSVGLRHKTLNVHHNLISKKKETATEKLQIFGKDELEMDDCLQFGKITAPDWLKQLPSEWTVVQITELMKGKEMMKELGGPPCSRSLPSLVLTRLPCGPQPRALITSDLEAPTQGIESGGLLSELNSILEGNRRAYKDFRGNREMYFKVKQEHHNQLKVLVNSLENWWLGYFKCILVGELKEPSDINILNRVTSSLTKLVKRLKGTITQVQEHWIRLILSSYGHLNRHQLIRGIAKSLGIPPRSGAMSDILKYLNTVDEDLNHLKNAKRNPVIFVLDKVIQQIPWESMSALDSTPISRVPSLYILLTLALKHGFNKWSTPSSPPSLALDLRLQKKSNIDVNPKLAFYVLNPGQDLPGVQQRLQPILEDIWGKQSGVIGTIPVEQEIKKSLTDRDVFLYCGHGSGTQYFSIDHIIKLNCRAAPLLMGCSSGQLKVNGRQVDPTGAAANYLIAGSPSLVGMLWEVTDLDCDRFTVRFLDMWLGARQGQGHAKDREAAGSTAAQLPPLPDSVEPELLRAVSASRHITKYFTTGAAVVVYGLPIRASDS